MTTLAWPNFWSFLFFTMLFTVGIDSVFGMYDFSIAYFWSAIPNIQKKMRKEVFVLCITLCYFLLGLIFVTNNGYWNFTLFNNYAAGLSLVYVLVVETSMIAYYFGLDKLEVLIYKKTGERLPLFFKICIKFVSVPLIGLTFFIGLYNEFVDGGEDVRWT